MLFSVVELLTLCGLGHALRAEVKGIRHVGIQAGKTDEAWPDKAIVASIAFNATKDIMKISVKAERKSSNILLEWESVERPAENFHAKSNITGRQLPLEVIPNGPFFWRERIGRHKITRRQ